MQYPLFTKAAQTTIVQAVFFMYHRRIQKTIHLPQRKPTMSTHRYLTALPQGKNQVSLSWRFFSTDAPDAPFHIERRRPNDTWQQISKTPITQSTDFQDQPPEPAEYEYRVVTNDTPSELAEINS